ncbi:MAG: lipid-A-disaccharide synthase [Acidaminococcaceae bacterium]|nr:lipid-A-disaccharide synthase [Acidaminococcaceae bacterium]MCI2109729.1 lipid-A-disaccharide synthase [Acidaminococcaceae bacterium]
MTKIFLSAGEASGDLHAGAITKAILKIDPEAQVFGMGGDAMRKAGGEVIFDLKEYSVMGFVEILSALPKFFALRNSFRKVMEERKPDCFVTIDYPEFNMRAAKVAKELKIPVLSYIPPSAWAWRKGRAVSVGRLVDKVACIYPFAYDVYKAAGANAEFVGNPLVDIVKPHLTKEEAIAKVGKEPGIPLVLLLPGSRVKEITGVLPIMLEAVGIIREALPQADFVLQKAPTIDRELLQGIITQSGEKVRIVEGDSYDVMGTADVALATSGTVTLEAALCGLPTVICYTASPLSMAIAKRVVTVKFIGLPNILADKEILPELIQEKMTSGNMAKAVLHFLHPEEYKKIREELAAVVKKLGPGGATQRVAKMILNLAGDDKC